MVGFGFVFWRGGRKERGQSEDAWLPFKVSQGQSFGAKSKLGSSHGEGGSVLLHRSKENHRGLTRKPHVTVRSTWERLSVPFRANFCWSKCRARVGGMTFSEATGQR